MIYKTLIGPIGGRNPSNPNLDVQINAASAEGFRVQGDISFAPSGAAAVLMYKRSTAGGTS